MSAESTILAGRSMVEGDMKGTCVITRVTTTSTDHSTGLNSDVTSQIYSGPCTLKFPSVRPEASLVEGQQIAQIRGILKLPVIGNSSNVRANDVAAVTVSADLDPGLVINVEVEAPFAQTYATSRRFPVRVLS